MSKYSNFYSLPRKNYIINGNFDIWQRATSQTNSGYSSDDRWLNGNVGSGKTHSQQSFTIGQTDVPNNPKYYSRTIVSSTGGITGYVNKAQRVESVYTLAGETATLSFYAKSDSTANIAVEFAQLFGTGGSPSATVTGIGVTTIALTSSWQKFTVTVDIPSISGKTLGSNSDDALLSHFWFDAGSTYDSRTNSLGHQTGTFDIAQVQLEKGSVATPFEIRPIGVETELCQRYFQTMTFSSFNALCIVRSSASGTSMQGLLAILPTKMRTPGITVTNKSSSVTATYVKTDTQGGTSGSAGATSGGVSEGLLLYLSESVAGTNAHAYMVYVDGAMTFWIDAEL